MKFVLALLFTISFSVSAQAQRKIVHRSTETHQYDKGIGAIIGSPTGISGFFDLSTNRSLAWAVAYNFSKYAGVHIHLDYLFNNDYRFNVGSALYNFYYGIGGRSIFISTGDDKNSTNFGLRAPIGALHRLQGSRVMIFGEIVPVLNLAPGTSIGFDFGIGARFLF
jgi:hypothetical protein